MVTATAAHPVKAPAAASKILPVAVTVGAVSLIAGYVASQLKNSRNIMDNRFAQYNSSQSEENRAKTFEGNNKRLDPRTSMFNVLGH